VALRDDDDVVQLLAPQDGMLAAEHDRRGEEAAAAAIEPSSGAGSTGEVNTGGDAADSADSAYAAAHPEHGSKSPGSPHATTNGKGKGKGKESKPKKLSKKEQAELEAKEAEEAEAQRLEEEKQSARIESARMREEDEAAAAAARLEEEMAIFSKGFADADGTPLSPLGEPCVFRARVSPASTLQWMVGLRSSLLDMHEDFAAVRLQRTATSAENLQEEWAEELSDRLRDFAPRRGEIEVRVREVRQSELLAHEQKVARHVEGWRGKLGSLQSEVGATMVAAEEASEEAIRRLRAVLGSLPKRDSLAAL